MLTQTRPTTASPATSRSAIILSSQRLDAAETLVRSEPFAFLVARNQLPAELSERLIQDFPRYQEAGFFPYEAGDCGQSINTLIDDLNSPEIANAIGSRLGIENLGQYPTLVSLSRSLHKGHGKIHTDSRSKIVTALLYLNLDWPQTSNGCLRFLERIDDMESLVTPEVRPIYGTLAAFRRADNSFHGHLPHQGERLVIQVAWVTSEKEKLRKTQRGRTSKLLKRLIGFLGYHSSSDREAKM